SLHVGLNESHNGYLEIFLTLGWIGVLLLATTMVTGYRNIVASFRQDPMMGRLRMALFVSVVVLSFTEAGFRMLTINWIVFLMAGMAVPQDQSPENHIESPGTFVLEEMTETETAVSVASDEVPWGSEVPA